MPQGVIEISQRALKRVVWIDNDDPNNKLESLFNPENLSLGTSASVGELNPIGWSQPVQMYSHTDALRYSVTLPFSYQAYIDMGVAFTSVHMAHGFFRSFLYGAVPGLAPSFLILNWPGTAYIVNTVRSVNVDFTTWDENLNLRNYTVTLELVEVRRNFLSSTSILANDNGGLTLPDADIGGKETFSEVSGRTGKPTRVKGTLSPTKGSTG